jgi:hypothetical protein
MHLLSKQHGFIVLAALSFEIIKCAPHSLKDGSYIIHQFKVSQ